MTKQQIKSEMLILNHKDSWTMADKSRYRELSFMLRNGGRKPVITKPAKPFIGGDIKIESDMDKITARFGG